MKAMTAANQPTGSPVTADRSRQRLSRTATAVRLGFALLLTLAACGGGSSPTEPDPPPEDVTLDGVWQGSLTAVRVDTGGRMTCDLTFNLDELDQPGLLTALGSWRVACPDGSSGGGIVNVTVLPLGLTSVSALPGDALSDCGWGGLVSLTRARMQGDWETAQGEGCEVARRGELDVRK